MVNGLTRTATEIDDESLDVAAILCDAWCVMEGLVKKRKQPNSRPPHKNQYKPTVSKQESRRGEERSVDRDRSWCQLLSVVYSLPFSLAVESK